MTAAGAARASDWPVVVVEVVDLGPERSNEAFWTVLADALGRGGRFGLVVVKPNVDPADARPRSRTDVEGMRWLKSVRGEVAERCAGIAYVLSETVIDDEWTRRLIAAGPTVYGCPTEAFAELDAARRWAADALAAGPAG